MKKLLLLFTFIFTLIFFNSPCYAKKSYKNVAEKTIATDNLAELQTLIKNGTEINSKNRYGETLLMQAIRRKKGSSMAKWLIDNGADIKHRSGIGTTALVIACMKNKPDIVKLLVEKGANINDPQNPPIFWCTNIDILKLVIELGADVHLRSTGNVKETVFEHFARRGRSQVTLEILNHNVDLSNSLIITSRGIKVAEKMIELGISPNKLNKKGETVLFANINLTMAGFLLSRGADPNIKSKKDGATILIRKIRVPSHYTPFIKLLMNYGADPHIKDNDQKNAFDYADDIINNGSIVLETTKFSYDLGFSRGFEDLKKKILSAQLCIDIMNSKPGKTFDTYVTNKEREKNINKHFVLFKELRGKTRYKEFNFLLISNFSAPGSLVGHAVDFYRPRKPYAEKEIIKHFGPIDKKDSKGNIYYYLGFIHNRHYYALFVMNRGQLIQAAIIPNSQKKILEVKIEKYHIR